MLVGHGLVERQVRGPGDASGAAEQVVLRLRRYRCRTCRAVCVVGPRGLVHRRWYGAAAIALSLARYARGESTRAVRAVISPARTIGASASERWSTLVRWIDTVQEGRLFGVAGLSGLGRRAVAERVVLALAARAGHEFGADLLQSAFDGATIAAL